MNLSRRWLSDYVDLSGVSDKEFNDRMTMSGSKVETIEVTGSEVSGVVVGRVDSIVRHPNSDHMFICQMDVGRDEPVQVVTGAQNVQAGDLCPTALDGATLPGGIVIHNGVLRGEVSNGMLCSLKELGLEVRDFPYAIEDGIFILQEPCKPGDDIRDVVGFGDSVVEFEITNNRADCFGMIGLAREAAATFDKPLTLHTPEVKGAGGNVADLLDVEVLDPEKCMRYSARMVTDIKIEPSPKWMRQRLRALGVRPINNIVDITNYVMLEYGQPMHAFDYNYIRGGRIIVRTAGEDKEVVTLDGQTRKLQPNMLMICDERGPVGVAGVMGGENSEITENTKAIVFESACFSGPSVRTTAVALNLRTDASSRFEKGLDPQNTVPALQRACELVELLGAGKVVDGMIDVLGNLPEPAVLPLEPEKINKLIGIDVSADYMKNVLEKLGFTVDGDYTVHAPSWRADIECNADLAEEIARFYGYDNVPTTMFRAATEMGFLHPIDLAQRQVGHLCRGMGYTEILTYSFVSPKNADRLRWPEHSPLRNTVGIINPLGEDTSVMRTSTLPSMLEVLERNWNYRNKAVKFYETGKVYLPVEGQTLPDEPVHLSLGMYGTGDFFSLKGEVEAIFQAMNLGAPVFRAEKENPSFHPGRCAVVSVDGKVLGTMGQIHPKVAENYGIDAEVYCAEFDFTQMLAGKQPDRTYTPLPRYPAVSRDVAVVCLETITVAELESCIQEAAGELLKSIELFDIYTGAPIAPGYKSAAFSLEFRAEDRTLTDEDCDREMAQIISGLQTGLGAVLRS